MSASRNLLKAARLFHLYAGVFFTPALLFFAFTGSVQSLNFHEAARGPGYKPPMILVKLAQLHKKETLVLPERRQQPKPEAQPTPAKPAFDPSHLGDHTNQQKHDTLDRPTKAADIPPPPASPILEQKPSAPAQSKKPNTLPLKIFSFWAGVGLFLSTLTGLYMSYRYTRNKIAITATLIAGLVLPLFLLYIQ